MNKDLNNMLDCEVTIYMGNHVLKGTIGETDSPEILVLHTTLGMASIRIEQVSAYILHS